MFTESGLLVFKIIDGDLAHPGCYLEVIMDDMMFPSYSSAKARSRQYTFNETGDTVVRELDLSKITLRLVSEVDKKGDDGEEHVEGKLTGNTLEVLRRALYTPTQLSLKDKSGRESKVTVSLRFLPLRMQLDPSESFNNTGNLRVEVLDAADLPAADRNGYSDPYCKFKMQGKDVYKTKTQKKTLHPAWNEFFEVPVRSRTAAKFTVDVMDWDFGDKADFLGAAPVDLTILEPFQAQEVTIALDDHGKLAGALRLKLLFKPEYVVRSRQGSSTFSGTFSAPGKIVGAPVKGVSKVGGGVVKGAGFLGRGFKRRTVSGSVENSNALDGRPETAGGITSRDPSMEPMTPERANGGVAYGSSDGRSSKDLPGTPHSRQRSFGNSAQASGAELGTGSITIISARGFEDDTKLEIRVTHDSQGRGFREIIKTRTLKARDGGCSWGEDDIKRLPCNASDSFKIEVKNHKTFGSDDLGEATFFLDDQGTGGAAKEIAVGSTGGIVTIKTAFSPADAASGSPKGASGGKHLGRFMSRRERSVTPSAG